MKSVKEKLCRRELVLMAFLDSHDVRSAEIMVRSGIDLLALDLEQNAFSDSEIVAIAGAVSRLGGATLVRTTAKERGLLSHYMDLGVDGILSTECESAEDARRVVQAVKYPPEGTRGVSQLSPALDYGFSETRGPLSRTLKEINDSTIVFVTLESRQALLQAGEIAEVPGVDSVQIGPTDLAISMGYPGPGAPQVQELIRQANAAIAGAGSRVGGNAPEPEKMAQQLQKGVTVQLVGSDTSLLKKAACILGEAKMKLTGGKQE